MDRCRGTTRRKPSWSPSAPARPMLRSSIPWERCCSAGFCYGSSGGNGFSSRSEEPASLRRMWAREIGATRFLYRLEFHQLDARKIGIKHVELPLAVFAHLRLFVPMLLPVVGFHDRLRFLHVRNAERDVIHHTRQPHVRMLWLAEHVFQPIRAVRNLH